MLLCSDLTFREKILSSLRFADYINVMKVFRLMWVLSSDDVENHALG